MATPVGHVLAGLVAYRAGGEATGARGRGLAVLTGVAAVAPDADFLPGLLVGTPALYHQGTSHCIAAAIAFGFLATVVYRRGLARIAGPWAVISLGYLSHLVLDLFGPDRRAPYGIPLFWPWSAKPFLSPVTLLPGVHHASSTGDPTALWLNEVLRFENVLAVGAEVALVAPFLVAAELWVRRRRTLAARSAQARGGGETAEGGGRG